MRHQPVLEGPCGGLECLGITLAIRLEARECDAMVRHAGRAIDHEMNFGS